MGPAERLLKLIAPRFASVRTRRTAQHAMRTVVGVIADAPVFAAAIGRRPGDLPA